MEVFIRYLADDASVKYNPFCVSWIVDYTLPERLEFESGQGLSLYQHSSSIQGVCLCCYNNNLSDF